MKILTSCDQCICLLVRLSRVDNFAVHHTPTHWECNYRHRIETRLSGTQHCAWLCLNDPFLQWKTESSKEKWKDALTIDNVLTIDKNHRFLCKRILIIVHVKNVFERWFCNRSRPSPPIMSWQKCVLKVLALHCALLIYKQNWNQRRAIQTLSNFHLKAYLL